MNYFYIITKEQETFLAKVLDLEEDFGLVSFNEKKAHLVQLCDYEDTHAFFLEFFGEKYLISEEITLEKYEQIKNMIKL